MVSSCLSDGERAASGKESNISYNSTVKRTDRHTKLGAHGEHKCLVHESEKLKYCINIQKHSSLRIVSFIGFKSVTLLPILFHDINVGDN